MLDFILTIIKLLLALGIVATIHEFGHFIIAKMFKTQVNEFSIGFGPKIIQKKFKDTMYSLRWLPFGGYVSIEGEAEQSENENSFQKKKTYQKLLILVAGALFNSILAIAIFMTIASRFPTYTAKVTKFDENSVLVQAGMQAGDTIIYINGDKTSIAQDLYKSEYLNSQRTTLEYLRDGERHFLNLENVVKSVGYIGVVFKETDGEYTNEISMIDSGKAAARADVKAGDKIVGINNIETPDSSAIINIVRDNPSKEIELKIDRNGETLYKKLTPDSKKVFEPGIDETEQTETTLFFAWKKSYYNVATIVGSYIDLFKGKVKVTDMSGIVGIGEVVSKTSGWLEYFNLIGILSLAIGVANVMPFPPLDGGKMVIVLLEGIVRRKLPLKVEAIISYIGFGLLILLTIVVTYNDIVRIF